MEKEIPALSSQEAALEQREPQYAMWQHGRLVCCVSSTGRLTFGSARRAKRIAIDETIEAIRDDLKVHWNHLAETCKPPAGKVVLGLSCAGRDHEEIRRTIEDHLNDRGRADEIISKVMGGIRGVESPPAPIIESQSLWVSVTNYLPKVKNRPNNNIPSTSDRKEKKTTINVANMPSHVTFVSTKNDECSQSKSIVQMPTVPPEFQKQIEKVAEAYLDQFTDPKDKLWAAAAITRCIAGILIKPLTPAVRELLGSAPRDTDELKKFVAEGNAALGYAGIAICHPYPKIKGAKVAGTLRAARSTQAGYEHLGYLHLQSNKDKVEKASVPVRGDGSTAKSEGITASQIELMDSPRAEGRSLIRIG